MKFARGVSVLSESPERTKEYACIIMAVGQLSMGLFRVFKETLAFYNALLLDKGSKLEISLAQDELLYGKVYRRLSEMYKEETRRDKGETTSWLAFDCTSFCEQFMWWSKAYDSKTCKNSKRVWPMGSKEGQTLKRKAVDELAEYLKRNIVEPFDAFFVQASQSKERELSEETALQCKLVVDRKVGEYLDEESILGWPVERIKQRLAEKLDKLEQRYREMNLSLESADEAQPGPEVESVKEEFRAVMLEMLSEAIMHERNPSITSISKLLHEILQSSTFSSELEKPNK
ncbi:hypothetical protein NEMIN01_1520 [Nematocida minor]|uniref:uncharacterized protein n=1 Tax=Nematocida minor TaxID=1912983 RepID=UPI00221E7049|nr:uncharacterized protein NEMIN01_1520 [Nematocida minor]KAI5191444.1 hypothetical protein NEMIN01_1520 [Nematocida minor]